MAAIYKRWNARTFSNLTLEVTIKATEAFASRFCCVEYLNAPKYMKFTKQRGRGISEPQIPWTFLLGSELFYPLFTYFL